MKLYSLLVFKHNRTLLYSQHNLDDIAFLYRRLAKKHDRKDRDRGFTEHKNA
jgi:hypothetical protein